MRWTSEEITLLKAKLADNIKLKDIAPLLNRTIQAISTKAKRLGFNQYHHFSENELIELRKIYKDKTYLELSRIFNKSIPAIQYQLKRLNLVKMDKKATDEDLPKILELFKEGRLFSDIAEMFGYADASGLGHFLRSRGFCAKELYTYETYNRHKLKIDAGFNKLFITYRRNSIRDEIDFMLTREQFRDITSRNCIYCGVEPKQVSKSVSRKNDYIYNGIDKKIPNLGYTLENSVPCCWECNQMKCDYTFDEFRGYIEKIYKNLVEKENYKIGQRVKK